MCNGIVATLKVMLYRSILTTEAEAHMIGAQLWRALEEPWQLQELVDSFTPIHRRVVHNLLAKDYPDAYCKVRW